MSEMLPPPAPPPSPPPPPSSAPAEASLPWERASAGLGSLLPTIGQFVTSPMTSFSRMSLSVDLVRPIAYYVILVLLGSVVTQLWNAVFFEQLVGILRSVIPPEMAEQAAPFLQRPGVLNIVLNLVITPLVMLVVLFIWTALVHVGLVITGGAGGGFATTLRVICYARTGDVALLVPLFGWIVAFFWRRGLEFVGLSAAHKTDPWKALVAVLLPIVLCCACIALGLFAFGAALASAFKQM